MLKKLNKKKNFYIFLLCTLIISNISLFSIFYNYDLMPTIHDVDRRSNGNTFIVETTFEEILKHGSRIKEQRSVEQNSPDHKVIEITPEGKIVWELTGLAYPHEVIELPNDNLLIADTGYDRVIEVNYPKKDIVWSWNPKKINWTEINEEWDNNHYYNNPIDYDWTHLNDVDFKHYDTWDAILVSIRNFDLIVEINYTSARESKNSNSSDITWWYGNYKDHSLLNRQHNPDYLENGNIIVADSGNDRIIEIDYDNKEIVWKYDDGLSWPRDADELENGNILITDCLNCRIIEIEKDTKKIVWAYSRDLMVPYEADLLDNGNILIGNGYGGTVYEVNRDGIVVWRYGYSYLKSVIYLNLIICIILESFLIYLHYQTIKSDELMPKQQKRKKIKIGILIGFIIFEVLMFLYYIILIGWISSIIIPIMDK
ncbi:MAG: aryl-sulfate sulfotransferase [Promethearchaeota archaeon]